MLVTEISNEATETKVLKIPILNFKHSKNTKDETLMLIKFVFKSENDKILNVKHDLQIFKESATLNDVREIQIWDYELAPEKRD